MKVRFSLSKKLFFSGLVVLFFILLIALAGEICIRILKGTSHLVVVEFAEMEELQNVLLETSRVMPSAYNYLISGEPSNKSSFDDRMDIARRRIASCQETLTDRHEKGCLDSLSIALARVDSLSNLFFGKNPEREKEEMEIMLIEMELLINQNIEGIETLLNETKQEVDEYISRNETATDHSTATIVSLSVFLILAVISGGFFFIRKITTPSKQLLETMQAVIHGDLKANVAIQSQDEFGAIAQVFNQMLERIDQVTVSKNRYTRILDSMFNSVIVSDMDGRITSLNKAACIMLGDSEENLSGMMLADFMNPSLDPKISSNRISYTENEYQAETTLLNRKGISIPVFYSRSGILEDGGNLKGFVSVFHDLTEQKGIEQEIRQIRRERAVAIHEAQEKERLRIATDLHDGIVQMLTSVSYSIQTLESEISNAAADVRVEVTKAKAQVNMAIAECRRIAHNLIPLALHDFGLVPAISNLIGRLNQENPIRFHFDSFNMEQRTDPRIEKVIYRIFQESVNNILKHSQATEAHIQLIRHEDTVVLIVEDDGIGFNPGRTGTDNKGIGLETIKARVDDFGGNLTIRSSGNEGTELIIEIPYPNFRS